MLTDDTIRAAVREVLPPGLACKNPALCKRGLMRFPEVKTVTGLSWSTIDRMERAGLFPKRVLISAFAVGWHRSEVLDWTQSRETR